MTTLDKSKRQFDTLERLLRIAKPVYPARLRDSAPAIASITSRIQPQRRIGGGATSTVYEALDGDTRVALKVLNDLNPHQIYRLKQEFRLLSSLLHPNVVTMYELFGTDTTWFFSMELVHGRPMDEYWALAKHGDDSPSMDARDVPQLRNVMAQLIEGVAAVHRAGLLHRDLKPSNVLVESSGRLVLVDFGLVSEQHAGGIGQTVQHVLSGTPGYIAPEQLLTGAASPASDWYAVGVILYQLITGRRPRIARDGAGRSHIGLAAEPLQLAATSGEVVPADLVALMNALLRRDPALRPSTATLVETVRSWPGTRVIKRSTTTMSTTGIRRVPALSGRAAMMPRLESALAEVSRVGPTLVMLEGPSGIGKTTVMRQFVDELQRGDAFVLEGRCYYRENISFKAFDGVIDHLSRILRRLPAEQSVQLIPRHLGALLRLFPVLERVDSFVESAERLREPNSSYELEKQGLDAIRELLCRIADRRPLVIVIDDLQWGDADSARLLAHVCARPNAPQLLVLASFRTESTDAERRSQWLTIDGLHVQSIELTALDDKNASTLAREVLGPDCNDADRVVQAITREAAGVPLFIVKMAQSYLAGQHSESVPSLQELISRQVQSLTPTAQTMLRLIAVAGRPLSRKSLVEVLGDSSVTQATHELDSAQLVQLVGPTLDQSINVYHERVREVSLSLLEDAELCELHRTLAAALQATGTAGPEVLSIHWRASGDLVRAAFHVRLAAEEASIGFAWCRAADLYRLAVQLGADDISTWKSYGEALSNCGRSADAAQAFLTVSSRVERREKLRFESAAVTQWLRSGHVYEANALLHTILTRVGITWPNRQSRLIAEILLNRLKLRFKRLDIKLRAESDVPPELLDQLDALYPAQTAYGTFNYLRGAFFASLVLPLALEAGEPERLCIALTTEAVYGAMLGARSQLDRQKRVCEKLSIVAQHVTSSNGQALCNLCSALCSYWTGDWANVIEASQQSEAAFQKDATRATWEVALLRSVRHTVYIHAGKLVELSRELPTLIAESQARNDLYSQQDLIRSMITVRLGMDDVASARRGLRDLQDVIEKLPCNSLRYLLLSSTVSLHLYAGEALTAASVLDTMWKECRRLGLHQFPLIRAMNLGMSGDCASADPALTGKRRRQRLLEIAAHLEAEPIAWAPAAAQSFRARANQGSGDSRLRQQLHREAVRLYRECGMLVPATLLEHRLACTARDDDNGAVEPELEAKKTLLGFGVVNPARWRRIMHSIY